jgi:hypothetical protein
MDASIAAGSASVAAAGGDSGAVATAGAVDVRVAVIGNVDSGKSTLVGCLTKVGWSVLPVWCVFGPCATPLNAGVNGGLAASD